jgi:hypothetical protein
VCIPDLDGLRLVEEGIEGRVLEITVIYYNAVKRSDPLSLSMVILRHYEHNPQTT